MAKASNDKQKVLILGALFVVMIGVGAFTFMGSSGAAPAPVTAAEGEGSGVTPPEPSVVDGTGTAAAAAAATNPEAQPGVPVESLYAQRDPFKPVDAKAESDLTPPLAESTPPPAPPTKPARIATAAPLPPMDPMGGSVQPLPGASGNVPGPGQMPGMGATNEPPKPSYRVSGVITGDRPMAVLEDSDGKQRLVKVGDRVDGRRVVAIRRGKVVLEEKGTKEQSETLHLKEDADKQQPNG